MRSGRARSSSSVFADRKGLAACRDPHPRLGSPSTVLWISLGKYSRAEGDSMPVQTKKSGPLEARKCLDHFQAASGLDHQICGVAQGFTPIARLSPLGPGGKRTVLERCHYMSIVYGVGFPSSLGALQNILKHHVNMEPLPQRVTCL